jgi:hypothetical protein
VEQHQPPKVSSAHPVRGSANYPQIPRPGTASLLHRTTPAPALCRLHQTQTGPSHSCCLLSLTSSYPVLILRLKLQHPSRFINRQDHLASQYHLAHVSPPKTSLPTSAKSWHFPQQHLHLVQHLLPPLLPPLRPRNFTHDKARKVIAVPSTPIPASAPRVSAVTASYASKLHSRLSLNAPFRGTVTHCL